MKIWGKLGLFAGGVLFGTAGVAVLKSRDAKKLYTHCTAAALRMKEAVMKTGTAVAENCGDIYADASDINEKRALTDEIRRVESARAMVRAYEEKLSEQAEEKEDAGN